MPHLPIYLLTILNLLFFAPVANASDPIYTSFFSNNAVDGYDTVAYFTEGKPVKGSSDFKTEYKGAIWQFSSAENLEKFKADPEQFAPQYGGYCSFAAAHGSLASIDPEAWQIENGKLYLNYSKNVHKQWQQDIPGHIEKANKHFPALTSDR